MPYFFNYHSILLVDRFERATVARRGDVCANVSRRASLHVCLKANLGHFEAFFSPLLRKIDFLENGLRFFNSVKAK